MANLQRPASEEAPGAASPYVASAGINGATPSRPDSGDGYEATPPRLGSSDGSGSSASAVREALLAELLAAPQRNLAVLEWAGGRRREDLVRIRSHPLVLVKVGRFGSVSVNIRPVSIAQRLFQSILWTIYAFGPFFSSPLPLVRLGLHYALLLFFLYYLLFVSELQLMATI